MHLLGFKCFTKPWIAVTAAGCFSGCVEVSCKLLSCDALLTGCGCGCAACMPVLLHTWCFPSFAHDQEPLEICEVLFERDEKRGSDTLYAAGWNSKVMISVG